MIRLSQLLAIEKGKKSEALRTVTDAYHLLQKPQLLSGIARTYQRATEDGEEFPSDSQKVQVNALDLLGRVRKTFVPMFDVVATKETANQKATAEVTVDGAPLLDDVPVGYLLFLEKQLVDLRSLIRALPALDPTKEWALDPTRGVYATEPTKTARTKKVPKNHVKVAATEKHPAQVEVYHEDVVTGYWTTQLFSGALTEPRVNELSERVQRLLDAVKKAREEANTIETEDVHFGEKIFDFLFN